MREKTYLEPVSDMAKSYAEQGASMLKAMPCCGEQQWLCKCMAKGGASLLSPPAVDHPVSLVSGHGGGSLLSVTADAEALLAKAQVKGYTKKDGTVVGAYQNKVVKTQNEGNGFHGEARSSYFYDKHGADYDSNRLPEAEHVAAAKHADDQFSAAANHLVQHGHFGEHEHAREFLDSRMGRHLHNATNGDLSKLPKDKLQKHYVDGFHKENPDAPSAKAAKKQAPTSAGSAGSVPRETGGGDAASAKAGGLPKDWRAAHDHAEQASDAAWNGGEVSHADAHAALKHSAKLHMKAAAAAMEQGDSDAAQHHFGKAKAHTEKAVQHGNAAEAPKGGGEQGSLSKALIFMPPEKAPELRAKVTDLGARAAAALAGETE